MNIKIKLTVYSLIFVMVGCIGEKKELYFQK